MLEDLKIMLGLPFNDESQDELLELLITQATNEAKLIAGAGSVTPALRVAILQMAVFNYNRRGTEGLNSENYSGASYNYADTYPEHILKLLEDIKAKGNGVRFLW